MSKEKLKEELSVFYHGMKTFLDVRRKNDSKRN